jgi:hypothetical protein
MMQVAQLLAAMSGDQTAAAGAAAYATAAAWC